MKRVRIAYNVNTLTALDRLTFDALRGIGPDTIVATLPGVYWRVSEWEFATPSGQTWILLREVNGHDVDPRNRPVEFPVPDEWKPLVDAPDLSAWGLPPADEPTGCCVVHGNYYASDECPRC